MGHSFKLSKNLDTKKNKKIDYSLILMIVFILIAIGSMIVCFVLLNKPEKVVYIDKKNQKKDYVYTVKKVKNETSDGLSDKIPSINIDNKNIEKINNKILTNYNNTKDKGEYIYSYNYNVNDNEHILSLKVEYSYIPENFKKMVTFYDTYNIDLLTGSVISDDELLKRYDINKSKLNDFIEAKFKKYYSDILKKKYYTKEECNYTCFLTNRGLTDNYLAGSRLYVKDDSLILYKFYFIASEYYEEEYFGDNPYEIVVKKAK